jgi:hypothetical protein
MIHNRYDKPKGITYKPQRHYIYMQNDPHFGYINY